MLGGRVSLSPDMCTYLIGESKLSLRESCECEWWERVLKDESCGWELSKAPGGGLVR
jgi:hypothetical protein